MKDKCLIIIPCLNEEAHLGNLVENLLNDTKEMNAQIIIIDGNSSDTTAEIAKALDEKHANVKYLNNPKRIQSAAINLAVQTYGKGAKYLIRMDAHATYPENFCRLLLEETTIQNADSVVVSMNTQGKEGFQKAVAAAQNSKLGNGGSAHRNAEKNGQWVDHGHHALISIEAFNAVNGYDESFSHNEDAELDTRLVQQGYKIWLTAKTDMIYYPRSKPMPLFNQYYKFGKGRARNLLKHKTKPHLRQMVPVGVAPAVLMLLIGGIFALPAIIWLVICLGYGAKLALDEGEQAIICAGPALIIMHSAWSLGFWVGLLEYVIER